ncbi:MAG TPA: M56 family metallopeptidase [Actinospica sp.]|nr:M56 family metallopeptidase [Actinospica sp.]
MSRRQAAGLALLAGLAVRHVLTDRAGVGDGCRSLASCMASATLLIASVGTISTVLRAAWLGRAAAGAVGSLDRVAVPEPLADAAAAAGIGARLVCVAGTERVAFCAGLLRPRVYVTAALAAAPRDEVAAVLVHEAEHMRRRDPVRRALSRATAEVYFAAPLLRFCHERGIERSELAADRAAMERVGPGALARALLATQTLPSLGGVPAFFAGVAEARIAQLLGDRVPPRRPSAALVLGSLAGIILAVYVVMCAGILPPLL